MAAAMWYQSRPAKPAMDLSGATSEADRAAEELGLDPERLRHAREWAAKLRGAGKLPGVVLAVARRGRVLFHEAYGDGCAKDGIVSVAAMPVVSATFLSLVDEGFAGVHDDVARYIPAFSEFRVHLSGSSPDTLQTGPLARPITMFHLLTHTWGFPGALPSRSSRPELRFLDGLAAASQTRCACDADFERLARVPLIGQPGERYRAGPAAAVVAHVISKITGKPVAEAVRERVTGPLGMADTDWSVPPEEQHRVAEAWRAAPWLTNRLWGNRLTGEHAGHTSWLGWVARPDRAPAAAEASGDVDRLRSTALDQLRLHGMLLRGGVSETGARVLSGRSAALMSSDQLPALGRSLADAEFNTHASDAGDSPGARVPQLGVGAGGQGVALGMQVVSRPAASRVAGGRGAFSSWSARGSHCWADPALDLSVFVGAELSPAWALPDLQQEVAGLVYGSLVPTAAAKHIVSGEAEAGGWAGQLANALLMMSMLGGGGLAAGMPAAGAAPSGEAAAAGAAGASAGAD